MCTQLNRLLGYAEGAGKLSDPFVEYVSSADENGSEVGKDGWLSKLSKDPGVTLANGSLSSLMHWVIVG